mgnify:CR=1 FL=1
MYPLLLETDQIHCYDTAGKRIDCMGSGPGSEQDAARPKHPPPSAGRFQIQGDLVRDSLSGALCILLLSADFFLPMRALGSYFHVAMNGVSAGKKIISLLEMEEPKWGSESVTGNEVVLDHVSFSYDGKSKGADSYRELVQEVLKHA